MSGEPASSQSHLLAIADRLIYIRNFAFISRESPRGIVASYGKVKAAGSRASKMVTRATRRLPFALYAVAYLLHVLAATVVYVPAMALLTLLGLVYFIYMYIPLTLTAGLLRLVVHWRQNARAAEAAVHAFQDERRRQMGNGE